VSATFQTDLVCVPEKSFKSRRFFFKTSFP